MCDCKPKVYRYIYYLRRSNPGGQPAYLAGLTTRAELGSQGVIFSSQAFLVLQQTGSHN